MLPAGDDADLAQGLRFRRWPNQPPRGISAVERRAQIVPSTRKVALARGAARPARRRRRCQLAVSTGLIHYHFATKHELLEAMLRDTAAEELSAVMLAIADREDPTAQLEYMIDAYLPSPRHDQSWALWINVWGEALRDPEIRRISEELDDGWVDVFAQVIAAGVDSGRSTPTTRWPPRGGCARSSTGWGCRWCCTRGP